MTPWWKQVRHKQERGISMIEVALLFLTLSLFFIPIAQNLGNKVVGTGGQDGTITALNRSQMRMNAFADNLMQRALTGNIPATNIASSNDLLNTTLPSDFNINNLPRGGTLNLGPYNHAETAVDGSEPTRIRYRWIIEDMSQNDPNEIMLASTPEGNRLIKATLVAENANPNLNVPPVSFSSYIHVREGAPQQVQAKTSLVMSIDLSGSMCVTDKGWPSRRIPNFEDGYYCAPYLSDRFHRSAASLPAGLSADDVQLYDDRDLDITWSYPDDNPLTPFNEKYIGRGLMGFPDKWDCGLSSRDPNMFKLTHPEIELAEIAGKNPFERLCNGSNWVTSQKQWRNSIRPWISRLEAMRNALLTFLVNTEKTSTTSTLDIGLVGFSLKAGVMTPLEEAQLTNDPAKAGNGETRRYRLVRNEMSWINRFDSEKVKGNDFKSPDKDKRYGRSYFGNYYGRGTNIYEALKIPAQEAAKDPIYTKRIVILLTDGDPWSEDNSVITDRNRLVNHGVEFHNKYGVTYYTVGFQLSKDSQDMLNKIADRTGGKSFAADDAEELNEIFETLAKEIQKVALLQQVGLYNQALFNELS